MIGKKKKPGESRMGMSLPEGYLSSVCEIKTLENELVSTGIISAITSEYIEVSCRTGISSSAGYDTEVKVSIFNTKLGFRIMVGKIYLYDTGFLRIVNLINILDYERRNFFRVRTNLPGAVILMPAGSGEAVRIPVEVEDLSLGGCRVTGGYEFKEKESFRLKINILHETGLFPCEVKRVTKDREEENLWHCGCSFLSYPQAMEDALCACIFKLQREHISNRP